MKRPARSSVAILAASVILLIGVGGAVGVASAAKLSFSSSVADYIPATIADKKVVIDPRSTAGSTTPSCEVPPEGVVFVPLATDFLPQESFGGIWDCGSGATVPTGFVVGLDALDVGASTQKLTKKALYAAAPDARADAGSVKTSKAKVNGLPVTVFLYRWTTPPGVAAVPAGTVFEVASAEPQARLLVTAVTPPGVKPLPYLTAMLKAGAGKIPRAG